MSRSSTRFTGKSVLVTGGGSGIGRAVALAFAREGARVAVAGRTASALAETVALIEGESGTAVALVGSVSDSADAARLVRETVEHLGALDIAVNNAGVLGGIAPIADVAEEEWRRVIDINLNGTWYAMKHQIAHQRANGGGAIVNISSNLGTHVRLPSLGAYAVSKAAVATLTRSAARDHIADGVRINMVSPGPVDTAMSSRPGENSADKADRMKGDVPVGRAGAVEEVAAAVLHLASEESAFTVGADLVLDGGITA
ncbi:SDR family NAD(P)-dependent oxidoreductase [Kitasatospora purpeofusca]|uniref:SDR family NAD(P)-dependent oxidoreductase n=1 Tax=Kitasatospora purpeofusca TaxID=67352 RepID=UPI002A59C6EA|nr:SDR family oxidoreductase [Kitasatospora purpeofusca]MDY0815643.1 SDR family oxidoreductase [Kitasatospora purpeofusca]